MGRPGILPDGEQATLQFVASLFLAQPFIARLAWIMDDGNFDVILRVSDGPDTYFDLDLLYHAQTWYELDDYRYEKSRTDHKRLRAGIKGMTLPSSFDHPLYWEALSNGHCIHLARACPLAADTVPVCDKRILLKRHCIEWSTCGAIQPVRQQPSLFTEMEMAR